MDGWIDAPIRNLNKSNRAARGVCTCVLSVISTDKIRVKKKKKKKIPLARTDNDRYLISWLFRKSENYFPRNSRSPSVTYVRRNSIVRVFTRGSKKSDLGIHRTSFAHLFCISIVRGRVRAYRLNSQFLRVSRPRAIFAFPHSPPSLLRLVSAVLSILLLSVRTTCLMKVDQPKSAYSQLYTLNSYNTRSALQRRPIHIYIIWSGQL